MNIFSLFKRREMRRTDEASWAAMADHGGFASTGNFVDSHTAESIAAVFACVQALSESTACLPFHVYQCDADGVRVRADNHPLARVLRQPNDYQSGMAFREAMTGDVLLHGNAFARKEYNGAGELVALHPLITRHVVVVRLPSGRLAYDYTDLFGNLSRYLDDEIFHLADRTEAGWHLGRSRIAIAREQLGLALAQREHGTSTFRNGSFPLGVLEAPADRIISTEQVDRLKHDWALRYSGKHNAGKTPLLQWGIKYNPVTVPLEDMQWIAAQKMTVEEVARIFRVPPTLIQDLSHGTYTNVAELGSQFVRYSLQRWLSMWEAEVSRQLLGPIARARYHAEHSVDGLLRGNPEARAAFYSSAITAGWMTVDEVRHLENLPPLADATPENEPDGDEA